MARESIAKILKMVITMMLKEQIRASLLSGPEALVKVAEKGVPGASAGYEEVRDAVFSSAYPHKIEAAELAPDKFLSLVILLLAYSAIDPNLVGTPSFKQRQNTVFQACNSLGMNRNLIAPVSSIEEALYQLFDRV
jgi:hypothetical protein